MSKIRPWFFAMLMLLLIAFPLAKAEGNIKSVTHSPEIPAAGQDVTVVVEVNSTSNITGVYLKYCTEETCSQPINMTPGMNNTYFAQIAEDYEEGTWIGYNITITYNNGSNEYSPIGSDYHQFNYTAGEKPCPTCATDNTLAIQILVMVIIMVLVFMIISYIRRRREEKKTNKKMMAILLVIILIISILAIALFFIGQRGPIEEAPGFTLKDTDGNTFNLSDYKGKVVVLDFMAISCTGCKIVEENLKDIDSAYGDEVVIISVNIYDPPLETNAQLKNHKEKEKANWTYAMDSADMHEDYNVINIPKIVIIDRDGYVTFAEEGEIPTNKLSEEIDRALSGEAEAIAISPMWIGAIAFAAGVASFFSPCSFPLLPGYVGYYLGLEKSRQKRSYSTVRKALPGGIASALGILFIYMVVGMILFILGSTADLNIAILAPIIGVILIVLGALMLTNIQYYVIINPFRDFFAKLKLRKEHAQEPSKTSDGLSKKSLGGLFAFGIGYGAAAAGCTLPIFGAIVLGALLQGNFLEGMMLFFLYGLGAAIFMIITTLLVATSEDTILNKLKVSTDKIKKISGALMIVAGVGVIIFYYIAMGG